MADLVAVPTDWLNTGRDWHSDFSGQAGDMVGSIRELADNGESFSRSWRDVLQVSDTVTGADIRNIYQSGPNAADSAVATFERQRAEGDRRLEYAEARADAGADLMQIREATTGAIGRIGARVDADPDTGGPNRSASGAHQGRCPRIPRANSSPDPELAEAGPLRQETRLRTASVERNSRRQIEARRLAERGGPLKPNGPRNRPHWPSAPTNRIEAMYGGYRLHPFFSGN